MQHYFDVEMAKKYGILESVLFNHFVFWIEKNRGWLLLCGQPGAGKSHLCTAAAGMWGAAIVSFALVIQSLPPIAQVMLISILAFVGVGCFFAIKGSAGR